MCGRVESLVPRYIVNVAHLTSNALALINRYASVSNEAVDSVWFSGKVVLQLPLNLRGQNPDQPKTTSSYLSQRHPCVHPSNFCDHEKVIEIYSLNHNASAALVDCAEELGDTVEMLQQSIEELGRVDGASSSRFQLSNIQTWVSAAFTNEDTCEDGFANLPLNGKVETTAHRHVTKAAHLTSNALALVNAYASAKTASP
ncbi:hypothetical protein ACFX2I_032214 [Malus domestica]